MSNIAQYPVNPFCDSGDYLFLLSAKKKSACDKGFSYVAMVQDAAAHRILNLQNNGIS